jgi:hypothetical protein
LVARYGGDQRVDEMVEFAEEFHDALSNGSIAEIAEFFTDDAFYINPLIHQGPVNYGNFDQTIQIRGRALIARLLRATLGILPDCRGSRLIHIVGGPAGGGFEWQAGGIMHTRVSTAPASRVAQRSTYSAAAFSGCR